MCAIETKVVPLEPRFCDIVQFTSLLLILHFESMWSYWSSFLKMLSTNEVAAT